MEPRYYNIKNFDITLVCRQCGTDLNDSAINKFNRLKQEFKIVLPACTGKCSNAPNHGWTTSGPKKNVVGQKRKRNIDVLTFRPRPLGGLKSFPGWLSDSKLLWNELRLNLRVKRQIKKRRKQQ